MAPLQLQVVWFLHAHRAPAKYGPFPAEALALASDIAITLAELKTRYPNVQLVFISSRVYGGYATVDLNPEPFAYESAYAVQQLLLDQIDGSVPEMAPPNVPWLVWGPYMWAGADGTHVNSQGALKSSQMIFDYMMTSVYTDWFRE